MYKLMILNRVYKALIVVGLVVYSTGTLPQTPFSFRDCDHCPEMIEVPKGTYLMGSNEGREEEMPVHRVVVEENFAVGRYEVTRKQYEQFIESSNYSSGGGCETWDLPSFNWRSEKSWRDPDFHQKDNHPVVCVNWHDAKAYVNWLSQLTGARYRLLSESEWEYVARAGSITKYSFGDKISPELANYGDMFRATTSSGSYPANVFGVHDMHGNAAEWVEDCWIDNYQNFAETPELRMLASCRKNVFRGGTWNNISEYLRSAYRYGYISEFKLSSLGFRVARQL